MVQCFQVVICSCALATVCYGVVIHDGPKNTTAVVGEMVMFHCRYSGSFDTPIWQINEIPHFLTSTLPPFHSATINGLKISSVQKEMNNWVYVCFFNTYVNGRLERVESLPAYLTVNVAPLHTATTTVYPITLTPHVDYISRTKLSTATSSSVVSTLLDKNRMSTSIQHLPNSSHYANPTPQETISLAMLAVTLPVSTVPPHALSSNSVYYIGAGIGSSILILIFTLIIFFILLRYQQQKGRTAEMTVEKHEPEYEEVGTTTITTQEPKYAEVLEMIQLQSNLAYATPKIH